MEILEYIKEDGSSPYKTWFDSLDAHAAAKVAVAIARLELGNTSNIKWFAGLGEYRINQGSWLQNIPDSGWQRFNYSSGWRHQEETAKRYHQGYRTIQGIQTP